MIYRRMPDGSIVPDPECLKKRKKLHRCNWQLKKEWAARAIRAMLDAAGRKIKEGENGIF